MTMKQYYCTKCGHPLDSAVSDCNNCGANSFATRQAEEQLRELGIATPQPKKLGFFARMDQRRRERRAQQKLRDDERARQFAERFVKGEAPQTLTEAILGFGISAILKPRVLTTPQGIITYHVGNIANRPIDTLTAGIKITRNAKGIEVDRNLDDIDQKLKDVLAVNPSADLTPIAIALNITILDDQRTGIRSTTSSAAQSETLHDVLTRK